MRLVHLLPSLIAVACAPDHVVQGRPYSLETPNGSGPFPLLVLLHGYSANGVLQDAVFPFSKLVQERQTLYAMPDGTRNSQGKRFWNATDACCNFEQQPIDDVAFLREVIVDIKTKHAVDPQRVFLVGHSNGAFMALRMACEASDLVSAVVSVSGAAREPFPECAGRPIPVLHIHGTEDTTIKFLGGDTGAAGGAYPSADETAGRYARRNGCGTSRQERTIDLIGDAAEESARVVFAGCPPQARVEQWTIPDEGHLPAFNAAWPARVFDWLQEQVP